MNVLVVSGIWPPDIGGPATHAPELAAFLHGRGHHVEVVTTAESEPTPEPYPVRWISRRIPIGVRHVLSVAEIARRARRADIVYSTGMVGRTSLAVTLTGTPLVLKITSDPAYERSLRYRLHARSLEEFQHARGLRIAALRAMRDFALARAERIVCPSAALRELALGWGVDAARIEVLPNPVQAPVLDDRDELRRRHGLEGPTLVFAGRLAPQKSLEVTLEAVRRLQGVQLVLAGDGPEAERLRRLAHDLGLDGRVRFLGAQPRDTVLELLRAGDVAVLSSSWENFPHMVVEALAVGTPVIATDTGGVGEILTDGRNGLLVPKQDPEALAATIRRYFDDGALQARLREEALPSVERFSPERIYTELEELLVRAAA